MATSYPHPIKVNVSLVFRSEQHVCCVSFATGCGCDCGPLVTIATEAKSPAAVLRMNHWLEADNVWGAKDTLKENYYHDDYVRTRLGR